MTSNKHLAMWSYFPLLCKTSILEAGVLIIALEVGTSTSEILHLPNPEYFTIEPGLPFYALIPSIIFSMIARNVDN
jgi:hypothetical protein